MARIRYASIVSDVSGSVGCATYQKNLYGNTLRNRPIPRKSASRPQLNVRALMMQCHSAWQSLSNAQRRQWNEYIAFSGQSINRDRNVLSTGHALFLKYNFLRLFSLLPVLTDISYNSPVPTYNHLQLESSGPGNLSIANVPAEFGFFYWAVIKISSKRLLTQSFNKSGLRAIVLPFGWAPSYDIEQLVSSNFGSAPALGDVCHTSILAFSLLSPVVFSPVNEVNTVGPVV